jgi:hypothetical protein
VLKFYFPRLACLLGLVVNSLLSLEPSGYPLTQASSAIVVQNDPAAVGTALEDWASLPKGGLKAIPPLVGTIEGDSDYTVELIQVQWRPTDPIDLYVIKPRGYLRPAVVLYLYGFPSDTDRFKNEEFRRLVTKGGFAAVGFVSALTGHRYHDRPMREWFISELQEAIGSSVHDVQMILDYLSTRGDLDMDRVGMFGQGSGATIGILAAAADARIKVLDVLDPWGNWPDWLAKSDLIPEDERPDYLKPDFLEKVAPLDPLLYLPKLSRCRLRLQSAVYEKNTSAASKKRIESALPQNGKLTTYQTLREFQEVIAEGKILEWMKQQLASMALDRRSSGF